MFTSLRWMRRFGLDIGSLDDVCQERKPSGLPTLWVRVSIREENAQMGFLDNGGLEGERLVCFTLSS